MRAKENPNNKVLLDATNAPEHHTTNTLTGLTVSELQDLAGFRFQFSDPGLISLDPDNVRTVSTFKGLKHKELSEDQKRLYEELFDLLSSEDDLATFNKKRKEINAIMNQITDITPYYAAELIRKLNEAEVERKGGITVAGLILPNLTNITPEVAEIFAGYKGNFVKLIGTENLPLKAIKFIAESKSERKNSRHLTLHLKALTPKIAKMFLDLDIKKLSLAIDNPISPKSAKILAKSSIEYINLKLHPIVNIDALTELVKFQGKGLNFFGFKKTPEIKKILSHAKAKPFYLVI